LRAEVSLSRKFVQASLKKEICAGSEKLKHGEFFWATLAKVSENHADQASV
jgi:hypothetical protein